MNLVPEVTAVALRTQGIPDPDPSDLPCASCGTTRSPRRAYLFRQWHTVLCEEGNACAKRHRRLTKEK